jgi:hypothetical protein
MPNQTISLGLPTRVVELYAVAVVRMIDASACGASNEGGARPASEHAGSSGPGLELTDHAALSVPTGERDRPEPESGGCQSPQEATNA